MSLSRNYVVSSIEGQGFPYSIILERKDSIESLLFANGTIVELTKEEADALKFSRGFTVEKVNDAYACLGVFSLAEREDWLVIVTGFQLVGKFSLAEIFKITSINLISLRDRQQNDADYLSDVKKLLSSGSFFFCPATVTNYDITRSIQRQTMAQSSSPTSPFLDPMSRAFFWNRNFWLPFILSGVSTLSDWLVCIICGGVEMRTVYVDSNAVRVMIISRLSCERAGTRFSCRGCNDAGHVANFVETEQVIVKDESELSSFVQIRGSVPLLWEQAGHNLGKHFVRLSRGFEACAPAFERHFNRLFRQYKELTVVNLLMAAGRKSNKLICEGDESALSAWYQEHHHSSALLEKTEHVAFDFHAEWKRTQERCLVKLWERLAPALTKYGFFHYADGIVRSEQIGVIRTNCIDCLDRTNCVQSMLAIQVLDWQLAALQLSERSKSNRAHFIDTLKQMWTSNGDSCSRIYAGTGAMLGGKNKYVDVATSASRAVQSGILDSAKHSAIHMILKSGCPTGELGDRSFSYIQDYTSYSPIWLCRELILRYPLYTTLRPLRIFIGSWNVNGGQRTRSIAYKEDSINDWLTDFVQVTARDRPELIDPGKDYSQPIDIYAIGFQEIVDLNAQNIMSADTRNQEEWGQRLIKIISNSPENQFIYLTSIQLVGVCLFVFIRPQLAPFLRDMAVGSVKTGLGGATGNKGGVAVRFRLHGSSVCFVCGHLAAGQNKVSDRNSDLAEIANRLSFPPDVCGGRTVWSHDYVFLFGDFNYRIGQLSNQMVRDLVAAKQYRELSNYEQLRLEWLKAHEALQKFTEEQGGDADQLPTWQRVLSTFNEGNIDFAPTYKYDTYSDDYDTSEKNRVPAWTDRILWTRRPLFVDESMANEQTSWNCGRLLLYNRAEVRTSDHRPVYALFDIDIFQIDEKKMKQTLTTFVNEVGPLDGTVVISPLSNTEVANSDDVRMIVSSCGQISAMRYVNSKAIVTFSDTREAAEALKLRTNTMFKFEQKFVNSSWFDAVSKVLASNQDDYVLISSNKLLAEPLQVASLTGSESPYPDDLESYQSDDGVQMADNEPNYGQAVDNFLSVEENTLHPSKSADNLRIAAKTPPPRPPPPQPKKTMSPSSSFLNPVVVSRPAVVETPIVVKDRPFLPKTTPFIKLTSLGIIHTSGILDDSLFDSSGENNTISPSGSKVASSKSIDQMLDMGGTSETLIVDVQADSSVVVPQQLPRAPPPNRPPPPKQNLMDDFEPQPQTATSPAFYLGDSGSNHQSIANQTTPLTSWPDEKTNADTSPPSIPPPRRPPPPAPIQQPASDPWDSSELPTNSNNNKNDPWESSEPARPPPVAPPPRTNVWPDEDGDPRLPVVPNRPTVQNSNVWGDDDFGSAQPAVPNRAPPANPNAWPDDDLSTTQPPNVPNRTLPTNPNVWPDDDFSTSQPPSRAPPPAPRTWPSEPSVNNDVVPPPAPRRAPPPVPTNTNNWAANDSPTAPVPAPPPRVVPRTGPPPPPPRRQ